MVRQRSPVRSPPGNLTPEKIGDTLSSWDERESRPPPTTVEPVKACPALRVAPEFRECVVYLTTTGSSGRSTLAGTGFIVSLSPDDPRATERFAYKPPVFVVTARHVVDGAASSGALGIRINTLSGGYRIVPAPREKWVVHPSADVAIWHLGIPDDGEFKEWLLPWVLTAEEVLRQELLGAPIFFVGLLSKSPGDSRNEPIVRFGHLASPSPVAMKFEPSPGHLFESEAYLVEGHSWGGQSGSPAFVSYGQRLRLETGLGSEVEIPVLHLLGLVSGHFDEAARLIGAEPGAQVETSTGERARVAANLGIAVVVPGDRIRETVDRFFETQTIA